MPAIPQQNRQELKRIKQHAHPDDWKKQLAEAIRSPQQLLHHLELESYRDRLDMQPDFTCLVTRHYLDNIETGNIDDPLLRQILPLKVETSTACQQQGQDDAVGDLQATAVPGLIHKYRGRALLISTAACAIHCRYCFRRQFPYHDNHAGPAQMAAILEYLRQHRDIDEIILSGGDPLVLDNRKLQQLLLQLQSLPQLRTLRIHSRLPVVLPARIDHELLALLQGSRLQTVLVIHANHANELDTRVQHALGQCHQAGIHLLNQSVLLQGVNDNADSLAELSRRLWQCHTLPYYLHLLDPVTGTMHFAVTEETALKIHRQMETALPGYLLPRLVREIPGMKAKTAIFRI